MYDVTRLPGYFRGPYTEQELREIDDYAYALCVLDHFPTDQHSSLTKLMPGSPLMQRNRSDRVHPDSRASVRAAFAAFRSGLRPPPGSRGFSQCEAPADSLESMYCHRGQMLQWPRYGQLRDTAEVLLAESAETYAFIEKVGSRRHGFHRC